MNDRPIAGQDDGMDQKGAEVSRASLTSPNSDLSATEQPKSAEELSAEEQMALYEKDLKENDWGHQPC
jgi:hypothetical protein